LRQIVAQPKIAVKARPCRSTTGPQQTVEPLFGNTNHNSGVDRFHRQGRIKVRLEWRLLMMTHNLTKVHRHQLSAAEGLNSPHNVTPALTADAIPTDTPTVKTRAIPRAFERQPPF
jgi:Transposase DDE domain